jgi:hypothetical protein
MVLYINITKWPSVNITFPITYRVKLDSIIYFIRIFKSCIGIKNCENAKIKLYHALVVATFCIFIFGKENFECYMISDCRIV